MTESSSQTQTKPSIGIAISTYNRVEKLDRCINSVLASTFKNTEIFVYCDNRDISSYEYIKRQYPGILVTLNQTAKYVVKNWNDYFKYCSKEHDASLWLVADAELFRDTLEKAYNCLIQNYSDLDGAVGLHQICPGFPQYQYKPSGLSMLGRKFIERYKEADYQVCCPDYIHFSNGEFYKYVTSINKFTLCEEAKVFHYHPSYNKAWADETHFAVRDEIIKADKHTAIAREHLIWGREFTLINNGT